MGVLSLKEALNEVRRQGVSQTVLARRAGLNDMHMHRLVNNGTYPRKALAGTPPGLTPVEDMRRRLCEQFTHYGIDVEAIAWPAANINVGASAATRELQRVQQGGTTVKEIELMQMNREVLRLFGLSTNPFLNDVERDEDVFEWPGLTRVHEAIEDAIEARGMLALISPSGAGKSTIIDGIVAKYHDNPGYLLVTPAVKTKEALTPDHLCRCLLMAVTGNLTVPANAEDRGRALGRALATSGYQRRIVLLIDDAHFAGTPVLRQLKTFYEEKLGRFRLLSIILIGIDELKPKLAAFPEIANRMSVEEVPPVPVDKYLEFKLNRVGSGLHKLFDKGGLEAFLNRYRAPRRPALGRPLIINADCIRAMVHFWQSGAQAGELISREVIDQIPGGPARRAA
jgi:type II secretory pathway predicted ATPase ExeA